MHPPTLSAIAWMGNVCLLAANGLDSPGLLELLEAAPIDQRFGPVLLVHSAVPPRHAGPALPQPLRWFKGRWARQMNETLAAMLPVQRVRIMRWRARRFHRLFKDAMRNHPAFSWSSPR